jgi:hypothetical protein
MVGCIVITLKDKNSNTGVTSNDSVPHSFTYMPLQSGIFTINKDKIMDIYSKILLFLFFNQFKITNNIYKLNYLYIYIVFCANVYYSFFDYYSFSVVYCASSQGTTNLFQSYSTDTTSNATNASNSGTTSSEDPAGSNPISTTESDAVKFSNIREELLTKGENLIRQRANEGASANAVTLSDLNIKKPSLGSHPVLNELYLKHPG